MVEFKIISMNSQTGQPQTDYELFPTVQAAEEFADMNPDVTVDFDSMIDWDHSENKYEYMV